MMEVLQRMKRGLAGLLCLTAAASMPMACNSVIYDDEGDCSITYRVRFRYDWNMKFADAFAHEVKSVTLHLIDSEGRVVWRRTESGEALAAEGYAMTVDAAPGTYDLLAWCSGTEAGLTTFTVPESETKEGLTCTLERERDQEGAAHVRGDLDGLYYGRLSGQIFEDTEGVHTLTLPLMKNTNNVRIVLQHLSGEPVDKDKFHFTITDQNGRMDWDNSLLDDETVTYHAWRTTAGTAGLEDGSSAGRRTVTSFSAAIAELTVARLTTECKARLTVTNTETGETVLSIPLTDCALLVKGYYNEAMDDQEYLDRQDTYDLVFFLDEGDRWLNTYIYINSWKVVLQQTGLRV